MVTMRIYAIYDLVAKMVVNQILQVMPNDAAAGRMFEDVVRAKGTAIAEHPEDYALVCLGEVRPLQHENRLKWMCVNEDAWTSDHVIMYGRDFLNAEGELRSSTYRDLGEASSNGKLAPQGVFKFMRDFVGRGDR